MIPNKSSLADGTKSSRHTTVTFQIEEDTHESTKVLPNKRPTRKEAAEPPVVIHEIRPWSSFVGVPAVEHVLTEVNKKSHNQSLQQVTVDQSLSPNQERSNRGRSALIDRNKKHYHRCNKLTWRSLFGTMSDINHIYMGKSFLPRLPCLQSLVIFIDSCFRGVGQIMFANNPLSGLVSLGSNIYRIRKNFSNLGNYIFS
jgi:hypothetical protein